MREQLDSLDRKILFELDCDSHQSLSELARKVRQGRDRVEYRVERLLDLGVILQFSTTINLYKLGLTVYKCYLRLRSDRKRKKEFHAFLESTPEVYRVATYDGGWDMNIAIASRTPRGFYEMHNQLTSKFHDIIIDYTLYTLIDIWRFRKGYFVGKSVPGILTGGEPARESLDDLEYGVLRLLAVDSRLGYSELAEQLNTTPAMVKYRLDNLEKKGIIAGYRLEVNHEKLGMLYVKTQLFLSSYQTKLLKRLYDFCENNPHITHFITQLGDCPLEIELEVESLSQYHDILESLRVEFSQLIENYRTMLISGETFKWLPLRLTQEHAQEG